jgi:hypothetical protein
MTIANAIAQMLMEMSESMIEPMREWLSGQEQYFRSQGYTPEESRSMAAATYVTVFGSKIPSGPPSEGSE